MWKCYHYASRPARPNIAQIYGIEGRMYFTSPPVSGRTTADGALNPSRIQRSVSRSRTTVVKSAVRSAFHDNRCIGLPGTETVIPAGNVATTRDAPDPLIPTVSF